MVLQLLIILALLVMLPMVSWRVRFTLALLWKRLLRAINGGGRRNNGRGRNGVRIEIG